MNKVSLKLVTETQGYVGFPPGVTIEVDQKHLAMGDFAIEYHTDAADIVGDTVVERKTHSGKVSLRYLLNSMLRALLTTLTPLARQQISLVALRKRTATRIIVKCSKCSEPGCPYLTCWSKVLTMSLRRRVSGHTFGTTPTRTRRGAWILQD